MFKLPYNKEKVSEVYELNEKGDGGYYPIGINNMWHSGIHLPTETVTIQNTILEDSPVYPIVEGTIVAYRIGEDYKTINKPDKISKEVFEDLPSKEKDLYHPSKDESERDKGIYTLKPKLSEDNKKHRYSNNFVLLSHEVDVPELEDGKIKFYTLYMNLAPDMKSDFLQMYQDYVPITEKLFYKIPFYRKWQFKLKDVDRDGFFVYCYKGVQNQERLFEGSHFFLRNTNRVTLKDLLSKETLESCDFKYEVLNVNIPRRDAAIESLKISFTDSQPLYRNGKVGDAIGTIKYRADIDLTSEQLQNLLAQKTGVYELTVNTSSKKDQVTYIAQECWIAKSLLTSEMYKEVVTGIYVAQKNPANDQLPVMKNEKEEIVKITNIYALDAFKKRVATDADLSEAYIPVEVYIQETEKPRVIDISNCIVSQMNGVIVRTDANIDQFEKKKGLQKYYYFSGAMQGEPYSILKLGSEFIFCHDNDQIYLNNNLKIRSTIFKPNPQGVDDYYVVDIPANSFECFEIKAVLVDYKVDGNIYTRVNEKIAMGQCIGYPAINKYETKRTFDFSVVLEKSLFDYHLKRGVPDAQKRYIYNFASPIKIFTRNREDLESEKTLFLPREVDYTVLSQETVLGITVKNVKISSIGVYLSDNELELLPSGEYKIKSVNILWLSTKKIDYTTGTYDPEAAFFAQKFLGVKDKLKNKQVKVLHHGNGGKLINIDLRSIGGEITCWVKRGCEIFNGPNGVTSDHQTIGVTEINPLNKSFSEVTIDYSVLDSVSGISEQVIRSDRNQNYINLQPSPYYILQTDVQQCRKSAFDWRFFFTQVTEQAGKKDDLFCDIHEVLKQVDEEEVRFQLLMWRYKERDGRVNRKELANIFGPNATTVESARIRENMRKIICCHPLEWNKDLYTDIGDAYKKHTGLTLRQARIDEYKKFAEVTDIWAGLDPLHSLADSSGCLWFAHPLYFLNHLDRAGVFEMNPYYAKDPVTIVKDDFVHQTRTQELRDNPGFAPYCTELTNFGYVYTNLLFATLTCHFDVKRGANNKRHTGVDFNSWGKSVPIKSFVAGKVWACTWSGSIEEEAGENGGYGKVMIIKGKNDKLYLLAHLSNYLLSPGDDVYPGMDVAMTGRTGYSKGYHLHLEVFECDFDVSEESKNKILARNKNKDFLEGDGLGWNEFNPNIQRRNPFDFKDITNSYEE